MSWGKLWLQKRHGLKLSLASVSTGGKGRGEKEGWGFIGCQFSVRRPIPQWNCAFGGKHWQCYLFPV